MRRDFLSLLLTAAQVALLGSIAAAEPTEDEATKEAPKEEHKIYACTKVDGEVVYQDDPCPDPPPVVARPPQSPKPSKVSKPPKATKPMQTTKLPAAIPRQADLKPAWVVVPRQSAKSAPPAAPAPVHRGGRVDARWETPRKTLKTFLEAVTSGDRSLVRTCLTASASVDLAPDPAALPLEKLRETVGSFTGFVDEGDLGPFWSIRALRAGTRPKWIFFERTGAGEWKIAGF